MFKIDFGNYVDLSSFHPIAKSDFSLGVFYVFTWVQWCWLNVSLLSLGKLYGALLTQQYPKHATVGKQFVRPGLVMDGKLWNQKFII